MTPFKAKVNVPTDIELPASEVRRLTLIYLRQLAVLPDDAFLGDGQIHDGVQTEVNALYCWQPLWGNDVRLERLQPTTTDLERAVLMVSVPSNPNHDLHPPL